MSVELETSSVKVPPFIRRQPAGCPPFGLSRPTETQAYEQMFHSEWDKECNDLAHKIIMGHATTIEKQALFDKLVLCDCCWRHTDKRPSCCSRYYIAVPAITENDDVKTCNCCCRHMMRFLAYSEEPSK